MDPQENKRAAHIKCAFVNHGTHEDWKELTWCGRSKDDAFFKNANHAIYHMFGKGHLLLCLGCAEAIKNALDVAVTGEWENI